MATFPEPAATSSTRWPGAMPQASTRVGPRPHISVLGEAVAVAERPHGPCWVWSPFHRVVPSRLFLSSPRSAPAPRPLSSGRVGLIHAKKGRRAASGLPASPEPPIFGLASAWAGSGYARRAAGPKSVGRCRGARGGAELSQDVRHVAVDRVLLRTSGSAICRFVSARRAGPAPLARARVRSASGDSEPRPVG